MRLDSNDFQLFNLPQLFEQNNALIDARWRELQAQCHPDGFVSHGPASQRLAMQWSIRINEAYRRLKNPLQRAAYLCELRGHTLDLESNTCMPQEFLMLQLRWCEAFDEANTDTQLQTLRTEVHAYRAQSLHQLALYLDVKADTQAATEQIRGLMFVERILRDIDLRIEATF